MSTDKTARAALSALIILQLIMLLSLFTLTRPHPPVAIPLFAIAPFLATSLSLAVAALIIGPVENGMGRTLAVMAGLAALLSFGPQKYTDPQFALIWPAVIGGQVAALALFYTSYKGPRA